MLRLEAELGNRVHYCFLLPFTPSPIPLEISFDSLYRSVVHNPPPGLWCRDIEACLQDLYIRIYDHTNDDLLYESTELEIFGRYLQRSDVTQLDDDFDDDEKELNLTLHAQVPINDHQTTSFFTLKFKLKWEMFPHTSIASPTSIIYYWTGIEGVSLDWCCTTDSILYLSAAELPPEVVKDVQKEGMTKWITDTLWDETHLMQVSTTEESQELYEVFSLCTLSTHSMEVWIEEMGIERYTQLLYLFQVYGEAICWAEDGSGGELYLDYTLMPREAQSEVIREAIDNNQKEIYQITLFQSHYDAVEREELLDWEDGNWDVVESLLRVN